MTKVDPHIDALQNRYHASLVGKRADIEQAWRAVCADCADIASQQILLRLVHRLAGSAESYGFTAIGQSAAQIDALLEHVRNSRAPAEQSAAMRAMLETLAREITGLLAELQRGVESGCRGSSRSA